MQHFQKIDGYKVISKCRSCGARTTGRVETFYCPTCLARLQKANEQERAAAEPKSPAKTSRR